MKKYNSQAPQCDRCQNKALLVLFPGENLSILNDQGWIIMALAASLMWGSVNFLDKTMLQKFALSPWDYLAIDGVIGVIPLAIILLIRRDVFQIDIDHLAMSIASGLLISFFSVAYFYALFLSSVARVVILIQITPIFSLIWGILIVKETYYLSDFLGMGVLFLGVFIAIIGDDIGNKIEQGNFKSRRAVFIMITATFFLSISYLFQDIVLNLYSTYIMFFWQRIGVFATSIMVLIIRGKRFILIPKSAFLLTSLVETLSISGSLAIAFAYTWGPLADVTFIASLQILWVVIASTLFYSIFSKNTQYHRKKPMMYIAISCVIVIVGLYLIVI